MKIYIVEGIWDYEGGLVIGAFDTLERAKSFLETYPDKNRFDGYKITGAELNSRVPPEEVNF